MTKSQILGQLQSWQKCYAIKWKCSIRTLFDKTRLANISELQLKTQKLMRRYWSNQIVSMLQYKGYRAVSCGVLILQTYGILAPWAFLSPPNY